MDEKALSLDQNIKYFKSSPNTLRRFITKRALKTSAIFGVILAFYMYSKADSYVTVYATEAARQKIAASLGSSVGIEALLGTAHHIDTVNGFVAWNFLCLITLVGAVWALLTATKYIRGEEDNGRTELFLSGQTTNKKIIINSLIGLYTGLVIVFICLFLSLSVIGRLHSVNFTRSSELFFSLSLTLGALEFIAIGALCSQIMSVRSRAAGLAAAILGIFYGIRLIADTTSAHWLLNISPLGWIEKLGPMYNSDPVWLWPIFGFTILVLIGSVYLAGKRDLNEGILADKDTSDAKLSLLSSPLKAAFRLNRTISFVWLLAITVASYIYGQLANGAIVKSLGQSKQADKIIRKLSESSNALAVNEFLGIIFLIVMVLITFYVASAVLRIRSDEASGYIDNFLVRPVSRVKWLLGRITLIIGVIILAGLLSGLFTYIGEISHSGGVGFSVLLKSGINAIFPALFVLGIGILAYGILPRLTSLIVYVSIGWSFLLLMLSSGLNLNHWLLDTSIFHQVALSPAASINWHANYYILIISITLGILGVLLFNSRDIQGE